jgi:hypothetical protein
MLENDVLEELTSKPYGNTAIISGLKWLSLKREVSVSSACPYHSHGRE